MAGTFISLTIHGETALNQGLADLERRAGNLQPAFEDIAEQVLIPAHHARFESQTGPDGKRWAPLSPSYAATKAKHADKILILNGHLQGMPVYAAAPRELRFGSNAIYAATQQFGARRGAFGKSRGRPIPWGNIPARPFVGMSEEDISAAVEVVQDYLSGGF